MGEIIKKNASRARIVEDAKTTLTRAEERAKASADPAASPWSQAKPVLEPLFATYSRFEAIEAELAAQAGVLAARRDAVNDKVDLRLRGQYDDFWNLLGRPGADFHLDVLYPEKAGTQADAPFEDQPIDMEVLADLLDEGFHPRIPLEKSRATAAEVRAMAHELEAAVEALRKPRGRLRQTRKVLGRLALNVRHSLVRIKRGWLLAGLSEAQIHEVIPDRPSDYGVEKKAAEPVPREG